MRWYNGFSPRQRMAIIPLIDAAVASGALPPPKMCALCGTKAGKIGWHTEDYRKPLSSIPICGPCHSAIHLRFWRGHMRLTHVSPLLTAIPFLKALSLDPKTMERPFDETYPAGLPRP